MDKISHQDLKTMVDGLDNAVEEVTNLVTYLEKKGLAPLIAGADEHGVAHSRPLVELQRKAFLASRDLMTAGASLYTLIRLAESEAALAKK